MLTSGKKLSSKGSLGVRKMKTRYSKSLSEAIDKFNKEFEKSPPEKETSSKDTLTGFEKAEMYWEGRLRGDYITFKEDDKYNIKEDSKDYKLSKEEVDALMEGLPRVKETKNKRKN
jgi:hypothetical protein